MKKTYINPNLMIIKIHTVGMIATSLDKNSQVVTNENDVLGRDFDFDDEDEY